MVTSFVIEFYRLLQPDNSEVTVQLLTIIAKQQFPPLSTSSGLSSPNQTQLYTPPSQFRAPASAVRVNLLWFGSLSCSLIAASLGMLTKQWLREYLSIANSTPRELLRIRQYRHIYLTRWKVPQLIAILPLLLQLSLTLFLVGLIDLLWSIHPPVATLVTIPTVIWILIYLATTCAPTFFPHCPFKSPQARVFYMLSHPFRKVFQCVWSLREEYFPRQGPYSFKSLIVTDANEQIIHAWSLDEKETRMKTEFEVDAIIDADNTFVDDEFLEFVIKPCTRDLSGLHITLLLRRLLACRLKCPDVPLKDFCASLWRVGEHGTSVMVQIAVEALTRFADDFERGETKDVSPWTEQLLDFICHASTCLKWYNDRAIGTSCQVVEILSRLAVIPSQKLSSAAFVGLLPYLSHPRGMAVAPEIVSSHGKSPKATMSDFSSSFVVLHRFIEQTSRHLPQCDPLELCHSISLLVLRSRGDSVKPCWAALTSLFADLRRAIQLEAGDAPSPRRHKRKYKDLDRSCVDIAIKVNMRYPGLVDDRLLAVMWRDDDVEHTPGRVFAERYRRRNSH